MQQNSAKQIYLEQIQNYLRSGQGYKQIRVHLFREILDNKEQNIFLLKQIVQRFRLQLNKQFSQETQRVLQIVQDFIRNLGDIANEAMNQQWFVLTMVKYGNYQKMVTLNWNKWKQIRERICGIFLYWFKKYQLQEPLYMHLVKGYRLLRENNAQFPKQSHIEDIIDNSLNRNSPNKNQNDDKCDLSTKLNVVAEQCQQIIKNCQHYLAHQQAKILDTQYVRMLKAKNKYLYQFSTANGTKLTNLQKQKLSKVYKGIRTILKEVQKINQTHIKQKKIEEQKAYMNKKMTDSPIKVINDSSKQISVNKEKNLLQIDQKQEIITKNSQEKKNSHKKQNQDLFEIGQKYDNIKNTPQKKISSKKQSSDLLDIDQNYSTPKKKLPKVQNSSINFQQLMKKKILSSSTDMNQIFKKAAIFNDIGDKNISDSGQKSQKNSKGMSASNLSQQNSDKKFNESSSKSNFSDIDSPLKSASIKQLNDSFSHKSSQSQHSPSQIPKMKERVSFEIEKLQDKQQEFTQFQQYKKQQKIVDIKFQDNDIL